MVKTSGSKPNTLHPRYAQIKRSTPEQHEASLHEPMIFHQALLDWYTQNSASRSIPWRVLDVNKPKHQHAYEVWVSEIMSQQTQIKTVIPYFERWMLKFPTLKALAEAEEEDVRALWTGLGYYSRATRLLTGAQRVQKDYKGKLPSDPKVLEKEIDGIGVYTAGAICSIAYDRQVPAVDGNVQRVYSRVFAIHAPPAAKKTTDFIQRLACKLVPESRPGEYNQALFDLGATICTPKNPSCSSCPISDHCIAYAQTIPSTSTAEIEDLCKLCEPLPDADLAVTRYPMAKIRKKPREEETPTCLLEWRSPTESKYLLVKRPNEGLLAGMLEFPTRDFEAPKKPKERMEAIKELVEECLGEVEVQYEQLPTVRHRFSHIVRDYYPVHVLLKSEKCPKLRKGKWYDAEGVSGANISTGIATIWKAFLNPGEKKVKKRKAEVKVASKAESGKQQTVSTFFAKKEEDAVVEVVRKKKVRVIVCSDED